MPSDRDALAKLATEYWRLLKLAEQRIKEALAEPAFLGQYRAGCWSGWINTSYSLRAAVATPM